MMAPAYEAAAHELEPQVRLIKLNSDAEQGIASRLSVQGIPTMILFHEGREVARTSGAMSATQIVRWVRDPPAHGRCLSLSVDRLLAWLWAGFGDWRHAAIRGRL